MQIAYPKKKETINLKETNYLMFIDIETIGTLNVVESCLPFEIGMKLIDIKNDKIIKEKSYLVRRFFNNKYIMQCTFSASKYPTYFEKLENDTRYNLYSAKEISRDIKKLIDKYDIKAIVAHNGKFDYTMLTQYFNEFEVENPFENVNVLDTMEMSRELTQSQDYVNYCLENRELTKVINGKIESNFITASGRVRTTAQAIYSFITKNPNFSEAHTGLEDIAIEYEIFKYCNKQQIVALNVAPTWKNYQVVYIEESVN